jgi:hypothetical protein
MDRYMAHARTLRCSDCGRDFEFTAEEQRFHRAMGFADPLRCAGCLAMRRAGHRREHRRPRSNRHKFRANAGAVSPAPARRRAMEGPDRGRNRPARAASGTGE